MATSSRTLRWVTFALRVALGRDLRLRGMGQTAPALAALCDVHRLVPTAAGIRRRNSWRGHCRGSSCCSGFVLIAGRWLRVTSAITSLLLLVFFSLIVRAAVKGQEISCGCFGPGETISWKTMLRDGSMLAGSLFVTAMAYLRRRRSPPLEPASLQPHSISARARSESAAFRVSIASVTIATGLPVFSRPRTA